MRSILILTATLLLASCQGNKREQSGHQHDSSSSAKPIAADTTRKSLPKEVHAQVGKAHMTIRYHAPSVRGRTIWGGLVPFDEVWVTGAHAATSLEIDHPVLVGGKEIPSGKYALFTIPGKEKWTIIINRNWEQHLADDYDSKDDVVRVEVKPELNEKVQERLQYAILPDGDSRGAIYIRWEKVGVSLPFGIR